MPTPDIECSDTSEEEDFSHNGSCFFYFKILDSVTVVGIYKLQFLLVRLCGIDINGDEPRGLT